MWIYTEVLTILPWTMGTGAQDYGGRCEICAFFALSGILCNKKKQLNHGVGLFHFNQVSIFFLPNFYMYDSLQKKSQPKMYDELLEQAVKAQH